jgi:L-ascorbate metabolism protein UlaG (beta-lactamase superfamily)
MRTLLAFIIAVALGAAPSAADRIAAATGGDILITTIIHSSVQLEHDGFVIQVDPWSLGDLSTAKRADLILITDDVGHHLDLKAIEQLRKPGAPIVIPASAKAKVPDGIVLPNGERTVAANIPVESIAAYDIKPGEPSHPKGEANGYLLTIGGKRIYFAGVTECVPEIQALRNIDVAFVPILLPLERMQPAAAADCVKTFKPKVVYPSHYNQAYAARLTNPRAPAGDDAAIAAGVEAFKKALADQPVEFRPGNFYPPRPAATAVPPSAPAPAAATSPTAAPIVDNSRVTVLADDGRGVPPSSGTDTVRVLLAGDIGKTVFEPAGTAPGAHGAAAGAKSIVIRLKGGSVPPLKNTSGVPLAFPRPGSKQVLENDRVVVWDYTWTAGVATPVHYHDKDVVVIYLEDGALTSTTPDGKSVVNEHSFGFTKFNDRDRVHSETLSKGRARAIIVELK